MWASYGTIRDVKLLKVKRPAGVFAYEMQQLASDGFGEWLYAPTGSSWRAPRDAGMLSGTGGSLPHRPRSRLLPRRRWRTSCETTWNHRETRAGKDSRRAPIRPDSFRGEVYGLGALSADPGVGLRRGRARRPVPVMLLGAVVGATGLR
jgi:hypothetical protein